MARKRFNAEQHCKAAPDRGAARRYSVAFDKGYMAGQVCSRRNKPQADSVDCYTLRYRHGATGWELRPEPVPGGPLTLSDVLPFLRANVVPAAIYSLEGASSPIRFVFARTRPKPRPDQPNSAVVLAYRVDLLIGPLAKAMERRLQAAPLPIDPDDPKWRLVDVATAQQHLLDAAARSRVRLIEGADVRSAFPTWTTLFGQSP